MLFALPGNVQAQTLNEELSVLLVTHPTIERARKDVDVAGEDVNIAHSEFLPDVDVVGDVGYEYTNRPLEAQGDQSLSTDRETAFLTVTENLFDGFRKNNALDSAKINERIADLSLTSTIQEILLQGVVAYHDVLRQSQLVELALANEERIREQLELEDERVRRGGGISVDVLFAKSRLQIAKERRVAFQGALRDANIRYVQVFNRPPQFGSMEYPEPPIDLLPLSLDEAIAIANNENPELLASNRQVDVADKQRDIAKSEYYPRVDLVGSAGVENNVDGIEGDRQEVSVLVEFSWNLFSGFETESRVSRASAEYSASMSNLSQTRRNVAEGARLAFNELGTAREREALLDNAVNISAEVFEARKKLREGGKETTVNVLDAETELNNALIDHTVARFESQIASYRLLAAIGRLTPRSLNLASADSASGWSATTVVPQFGAKSNK
ncbi:MAG: TolC family outer membrane protein [Pseudomonadota bacterium]